jgi:hypothetical protein
VHGRLVVDTFEAARDAACAGIGIASGFSYYAKTALERGALTTILDEFQPAPLPDFCRSRCGLFSILQRPG